MGNLYFKFGVMGSSKTAQALMSKYCYENRGHCVLFLRPEKATRDGETITRSRIGLEAEATIVKETDSIKEIYNNTLADVIIADESQFFTRSQIDELRDIVDMDDMTIFCYGLRTNFKSKLFDGSKRLLELADRIEMINMVCDCGKEAIINAKYDESGNVTYKGNENDPNAKYTTLCYSCWKKALIKNKGVANEKISK